MSTLTMFREQGLLFCRKPAADRQLVRLFLYTPRWAQQAEAFQQMTAEAKTTGISLKPSAFTNLMALVDDYASGVKRSRLIRPHSGGMDAPFILMHPRPPWVWEMRTRETRTFGWFVKPDVFVALNLELTDGLKANKAAYRVHADSVVAMQRCFGANEICTEERYEDVVLESE